MTVYVNAFRPRPVERKPVEKLLADLNHESFLTRDKARVALEKLGNDAKPFLREALKAPRSLEERRRLEALLQKLRDFDVSDLEIPGGLTVISVEELLAAHLDALKDTDATVCGLAINDLTRLIPYSDKVVPVMTAMLAKDKPNYPRRMAVICLGHAAAQGKPALAALQEALTDPDEYIRFAAKNSIEQIERAADQPAADAELQRKLGILQEINEFKGKVRE